MWGYLRALGLGYPPPPNLKVAFLSCGTVAELAPVPDPNYLSEMSPVHSGIASERRRHNNRADLGEARSLTGLLRVVRYPKVDRVRSRRVSLRMPEAPPLLACETDRASQARDYPGDLHTLWPQLGSG